MGGEIKTQTLKELKGNLKDALRKSGILDSVKAQIRREFISGLTDKLPSKGKSSYGTGPDLRERLSLSVIYHFLKHRNFNHALSVFAAECGLDSKAAWLSETDIIRSLQFGTQTEIYKKINEKENELENVDNDGRKQSVFDMLLNHLSCDASSKGIVTEISVQTNAIITPRECLDQELQNLRTSYITLRDAEKSSPMKSIEERMIQFQRECEERYKRESESYLNYMRETEISKVRLEESMKVREENNLIRKEFEVEYHRKLHEHSEREMASNRAFSDRDRKSQQSQYEARQLMQREIDDLRSREKSGQRKIDMETQGLQSFEIRLKEMKSILEGREREAIRKEKIANDLYNDSFENSKKEARVLIRSEVEDLNRERGLLKIEQQKMEDKKSIYEAAVESTTLTR
jgi:hypothetical protein